MSWKEKLEMYEQNEDWESSVKLMHDTISNYPDDVEAYIRVIYLLHNILLEKDQNKDIHQYLAKLLKKYFDESYQKFSDNSEYLFFIGKILHIAEWYFGQKDNRLAVAMQKRAMELEPGNILFEWAYRLSIPGDTVNEYLANQIMTNEHEKISWLKSKGPPGKYILEHLEMGSTRYLDHQEEKV